MTKTLSLITVLVFGMLCSNAVLSQETNLINAAGLQSGSYMVKTPPSYTATNLMAGSINHYTPEALFDQSPKVWCSKQNSGFPHTFVLELSESFIIKKLVLNNKCENYPGISSKDVKIEFSTTNSSEGFQNAGEYALKENEVNEFRIDDKEARWIRITVLSNYGNKEYTELAEFEAHGTYKHPNIKPVQVDGKWETNWGWVKFDQNGASVGGNYEYNNGDIRYGGINRNQITYKWIENKINQDGWTLLFMNSEGTRLTGVWCYGQNWNNYGFWIMERKNGIPVEPLINENISEEAPAPADVKTEVKKEIVDEMEKTLKSDGKVILYGINFKSNSSEITTDSYTVLDQVAELLKSNSKLKLRVEGHTDNVGSEEYNRDLSANRAASVKGYFVANHGVDENRLITEGKGENQPIADNKTEAGKAANRRVEIHSLK